MRVLSDVSIAGISEFLGDAKHHRKVQLFNSRGRGVGLVSSSARDGCLDISYGSVAKTALWGGDVEVNLDTATSVRATSGFFRLGACAGVPTGVPRRFGHGTPMVYDTSHNRLYAYNAGWKTVGGGTNSISPREHYIPKWDGAGNLVPSPIMEGHGWVFVNGNLCPGNHVSGHPETLGTAGNIWVEAHLNDLYLHQLKGATSLAVDKTSGKVIVGTSGPGSGAGNVSSSTGRAEFLAKFTSAQTIGPSAIFDTGQDLAVIGRNVRQKKKVPATATGFSLGTYDVPWDHVFTEHLRLTAVGANVPCLATNVHGDVVPGTANLSSASAGGTPYTLAMFTGKFRLADSPLASTGQDVVVNHHDFRQHSGGTNTLGTDTVPWTNVISKHFRIKSVPPNTKVLATNSNGDVVAGASTGSGLSGGIPTRVALWTSPTTIGNAAMSQTSQDFVLNDGKHIRQSTKPGTANCGTFAVPWNYVVSKHYRITGVPKNTKVLGTNVNGDVVASSVSGGAPALQREYLMASWKPSGQTGVAIPPDGAYHDLPTLSVSERTGGTGHINYDLRKKTVTIAHAGLYVVNLTAYMRNIGSASSGSLSNVAFRIRLTTHSNPVTDFASTVATNSGLSTETLPIPSVFTVYVGSVPASFTMSCALDTRNGQSALLFSVTLSAYLVA